MVEDVTGLEEIVVLLPEKEEGLVASALMFMFDAIGKCDSDVFFFPPFPTSVLFNNLTTYRTKGQACERDREEEGSFDSEQYFCKIMMA